MADFFASARGLAYFVSLCVTVAAAAMVLAIFECTYPVDHLLRAQRQGRGRSWREKTAAHAEQGIAHAEKGLAMVATTTSCTDALSDERTAPPQVLKRPSPDASDSRPSELPVLAPAWLERLMAFVYPFSLGLDEGIVQLVRFGVLGILRQCGQEQNCDHWTFPFLIGMTAMFSLVAIVGQRMVYKRFELSRALPIEYGTVTSAGICSGLVFYRETDYMDGQSVAFTITGLLFILVSIGVTMLRQLPGVSLLPSQCASYLGSLEPKPTGLGEAPCVSMAFHRPRKPADNCHDTSGSLP
uniref:Magnesium transporter n=1 Tax=Calcidiscus leptoporus TaxID=127549 RepID=A0A7S0NRN9_9EUKA